MSEDSICVVVVIERVDKERVVPYATLDGPGYLVEYFLCCVHEYLIQVFLLARLVEK